MPALTAEGTAAAEGLVHLRNFYSPALGEPTEPWKNCAATGKAILGTNKMPWPELANGHVALGVRPHRAAIKTLSAQIERIEDTVTKALKPMPEYKSLLSVRGIGSVIAWTIVLETGELKR